MEQPMSVNLSIKDVPDDVAERLRARAARNHRSLQGELMAIVEQAAAESPAASSTFRTAVFVQRGTKTIEEIAAESRRLFPQPIEGGPRAVDIIRQDRDSR
jgi:plasmid stability protein